MDPARSSPSKAVPPSFGNTVCMDDVMSSPRSGSTTEGISAESYSSKSSKELCAVVPRLQQGLLSSNRTSPSVTPSDGDATDPEVECNGEDFIVLKNVSTIQNKLASSHPHMVTRDCKNDKPPIFYAIKEARVEDIRTLLANRASPNCTDHKGRTPLHTAMNVRTNISEKIARLLLAQKADVDAVDYKGCTPLHYAEKVQRCGLQRLLVENGAKTNKEARLQSALQSSDLAVIDRSEIQFGKKIIETLKSEVCQATWKGTHVVTKQALKGSEMTGAHLEIEMMNELRILSTVQHADLVKIVGVCISDPMLFVSEYMPGGDLEHYYIRKRLALSHVWVPSIETMKAWCSSVARALSYLHDLPEPIIHRDLKPLNLLLSEDYKQVKVSDFGIAKMMDRQYPMSPCTPKRYVYKDFENDSAESLTGGAFELKMTGGVGSWSYMAPEVARHAEYDEKADIFSFALVMYFISSGRDPYHEVGMNNIVSILHQYCEGKQPRPRISDCPPIFRRILVDAWCERPEERPCASELAERVASLQPPPACCSLM
jgi:tRNA A-37 threonylcarbamoyl transferase component Bud32